MPILTNGKNYCDNAALHTGLRIKNLITPNTPYIRILDIFVSNSSPGFEKPSCLLEWETGTILGHRPSGRAAFESKFLTLSKLFGRGESEVYIWTTWGASSYSNDQPGGTSSLPIPRQCPVLTLQLTMGDTSVPEQSHYSRGGACGALRTPIEGRSQSSSVDTSTGPA